VRRQLRPTSLATNPLPGRPVLDPMDSGVLADFASAPQVDEIGKELQSERCGVAMRRTRTAQQMENGSYRRGISGQLQQGSSSAGEDECWGFAEASDKTMPGVT